MLLAIQEALGNLYTQQAYWAWERLVQRIVANFMQGYNEAVQQKSSKKRFFPLKRSMSHPTSSEKTSNNIEKHKRSNSKS